MLLNKINGVHAVLSFAFSRPKNLLDSVLSVKKNYDKKTNYHHKLIIDKASKNSNYKVNNEKVIEIGKELLIKGLIDSLEIRDEPYGTQKNIVTGISETFKSFNEIFILEDDLLITPYHYGLTKTFFKNFNNDLVGAFSTYSNKTSFSKFSNFYSNRFSSQAWGTWSNKWNEFDIEYIKKIKITRGFNKELSNVLGSDMPSAFKAFRDGYLDSWAIPWNVFNMLTKRVTAYTSKSFVESIGHKSDATRTKGIYFPHTIANEEFSVQDANLPSLELEIYSEYLKHFSLYSRAKRQFISKLRV